MPTRPKGIESAAIERGTDTSITTDGHSVVERPWTTMMVRGPTTPRVPGGVRGGPLFDSGGLFG